MAAAAVKMVAEKQETATAVKMVAEKEEAATAAEEDSHNQKHRSRSSQALCRLTMGSNRLTTLHMPCDHCTPCRRGYQRAIERAAFFESARNSANQLGARFILVVRPQQLRW